MGGSPIIVAYVNIYQALMRACMHADRLVLPTVLDTVHKKLFNLSDG